MVEFCLATLNEGKSVKDTNNTIITLIPKIEKSEKVRDVRPISLCNVLYKVISKCLVDRLRGTMDISISENQSAFVGGRQIFDNVMIGYEAIHTMS